MSSGQPRDFRTRLLRRMVGAAFFTWQSAVIIALFFLLGVFGAPPLGVGWWAVGLLGQAAYLWATLTDASARQRIMQQLLTERYNPHDIKSLVARQRLEKALEYYSAIQSVIDTRGGAGKVAFQNTLDEIDDWLGHLHTLGKRLDRFDENEIINRDRRQARNELAALEKRLKMEDDPRVRDEIERSISLKQTQMDNLQQLESNVKRADIQMDNTLSALGTVYAQMQLIGSKDIDSGSAQRLRNEVHDQILELQDAIAAIDDVQEAKTV